MKKREYIKTDRWLLNFPNGVLNLKTLEFDPNKKNKKPSMSINYNPAFIYSPETALFFQKFMTEITNNKEFA